MVEVLGLSFIAHKKGQREVLLSTPARLVESNWSRLAVMIPMFQMWRNTFLYYMATLEWTVLT
jgi:hypothetical protein